ncbi:hypothetical protein Prudu_005813, partial [Prunus dulcis]
MEACTLSLTKMAWRRSWLKYVLSRWRKDMKRNYIYIYIYIYFIIAAMALTLYFFIAMYKCIMQVVEEGRKSQDRYKIALVVLDEILNKLL